MDQRHLGTTGLRVSKLGLGTMTWGRDTDEHDAAEQFQDFHEAGGNLIDTAASYAGGASETLVGRLIQTVPRDDVVLMTKAGVRTTRSGNVVDASRGALLTSLDASLERLGVEHVDLFLVQTPDPRTPITETLSTLRQIVTAGKARYVGLSNHPGWLTARAATLLEAADLELAAAQVEYSLLERGIEREVAPAAAALGVGLIAWSPLGRGVLTGKYRRTIPADSRAASAHLAGFVQPYLDDRSSAIVDAVSVAASGLGRSPLDVALAWLMTKHGVASALLGARTPAQLRSCIGALDVDLPQEVVSALDEVSAPEAAYPERR